MSDGKPVIDQGKLDETLELMKTIERAFTEDPEVAQASLEAAIEQTLSEMTEVGAASNDLDLQIADLQAKLDIQEEKGQILNARLEFFRRLATLAKERKMAMAPDMPLHGPH